MAYITGIDVSQWQGNINWPAVSHPIAIIKMSGGDAGLYTDSKATQNYYGAKAAGKAVGMYHFAGGGNPENEADFFIAACSPLEENDVLVLDWEVPNNDPVGWSKRFVERVHSRTGVWPLIYFNGSTWNAYDWSPVTKNCGVWVAWYDRDPEGTLPVGGKTYVMHQFTSKGSVAGINGNCDMNAWFGTLEQFKKYGYHKAVTPSNPTPPAPVTTTKDETYTESVAYDTLTVTDETLPKGEEHVTQQGQNGVRTIVTRFTYSDGVEIRKEVVSDTITTAPVSEIISVGTYVEPTKPEPATPSKETTALRASLVVLASAISAAAGAFIAWLANN